MQKLAEICVRRPVFATMLIMVLVVLGLDSYRKLGVDLFPKVEFPTVTITTSLRGAAPEEIESEVTKRIEEAVNTISGIDDLRSISAEGISQVYVTFVLEKDPDVAAQEVRDKVAAILNELPDDVEPPIIEKIATDAAPVLNVVVSSPRDLRETTKIVDDQLKQNLESLSGVGQIRFVGDRKRQIQVWLDGDKLFAYNLNIEQVRQALASQNVEIPGGRLDQGPREVTVRTLGRLTRPADFADIIVSSAGGAPVRLGDIATIEDGVEEPRSLSLLDGDPAVVLEIRKQAGANTLEVIDSIKARIAELATHLPRDLRITYARDQSEFIRESFHAVQEHLILGGLFAGLVVLLFMRSFRSTIIAAIAIPTSIVSTYTLMHFMGYTLNQITMLALTLVVGIVIDDAIVVLENIFKFAEERGMSPIEAAIHGTRDIGLAVMATTLSLVIIFIPVAQMSGIVGSFMSSFGYTAAFAIMVSLLVSFTLTPMLCSRFLTKDTADHGETSKDTWLFRKLSSGYGRLLRWSMGHRWAVVIVSVLVVMSTVPLFMAIGKDFLPTDDQSAFEVSFRMPVGSSLEGTHSVVGEIEAELRQLPGIKFLQTGIGSDVRKQVDRGSVYVQLVDPRERPKSQLELMEMARERLQKFRDMTIGVQLPTVIQGAGPNQDLQFFLQGPDLERLAGFAGTLRDQLARMPGVFDVDSSYEEGKPEVRLDINRNKAADLGVNVASIANAVRVLVGGDEQVTTYREGDDRYDVMLRVKKEFRESSAALERLYVPSASLGNVPLSNVARFEEAAGPTQIERYNRQRQILLTANLAQGQSLSNVLEFLNQTVARLDMPPQYSYGLVGRSKEFGRAAAGYIIALFLSIVFMYMVLAAQFESFIDPVTILISLPLSVPFALLSLLVAGENFSIIYSSLGILILFGIVKKNSILQIDHIKSLRRSGMERMEAILHGCEDRLRPILMTTAALVAGMIPMALSGGAGAGSRRTVAIVVIGGQTLCLLLTLLNTPVVYSLFDDLAHSRLWGWFGGLRRSASGGLRRAWASRIGLFPVLLLALLAGAPARAQEPPRVGVSPVTRPLTLADAIERALARNLDLQIERTVTATAAQGVKGAQGAFDPTFRWLPSWYSNTFPTGNVLLASDGKARDRSFAQDFTLRWNTPWNGVTGGIDFENNRLSTNNPFLALNPYVNSRLIFHFSAPLLRNRETDRPRTDLLVRRKQVDIAETDFETRVIQVVTQVEEAFWDVVAAREDVQVKAEAVKLGQEQLDRTRRLIEAQTLAPVELVAAEAELERRRDTYFSTLDTLTQAENALKTLIADGPDDPLWGDALAPTESRSEEPPAVIDLPEAVREAFKRRPELRALDLRLESNAIERKLHENQTKPELNLVASYSQTGLGGAAGLTNPFAEATQLTNQRLNELSVLAGLPPLPDPNGLGGAPPASLTGGLGTAWSNVFAANFPSFQAGLSFDFTFRNQRAEADLAQTRLAERRLKLETTRTRQLVEAQVRNALQALETARQRIKAAEASALAAQEKLESEIRLFQNGESTNFLVLTRQNELADSRFRAVVARLSFNKAVARLEQALGTTLAAKNVRLEK